MAERHCVRFEFLPGAEPAAADGAPASAGHFAELGEITARMHGHARTWARPGWFTRFAWDADAALGPGYTRSSCDLADRYLSQRGF
jgi:Ser/Thr protein kinase RdoA (MazF antagonist)